MRIRLRKVEVECFRGFRDRRIFEFTDGVTLIVGPVGAGKTSLLSAVQFALYGLDFNVAMGMYPREALVNVDCTEARVQLQFEVEGKGVYKVERKLSLKGGRALEECVLETPQGEVFRGANRVNSMVEELLGLDFQEFIRSVSISYILVHMLAYGRPLTRSRAIDVLLGINAVRGFYESIPLARVRGEVERVKGELSIVKSEYERALRDMENLNNRRSLLEESARSVEAEISKVKARLEELRDIAEKYDELARTIESERSYLLRLREKLKYSASELDIYRILGEAEDVKFRLRAVLERLMAPQDLVERLDSLSFSRDNAEKALAELERMVDEAWSRYERVWEDFQGSEVEVRTKKAELDALEKILVELEPRFAEYEEAEKKLEELEKKYGKLEDIESKLRKIEQSARELAGEAQFLKCVVRVRQQVAEDLKRKNTTECPVCGSRVELRNLESGALSVDQVTGSILELEKKIQESERHARELRSVVEDMRGLRVTLVERELDYEKFKEYLQRKEELEEELREDELLLMEKEREYKEISATLTRLDQKVRDLHRRLEEYKIASEVFAVEAKLRELEEEWAKLEPHYREYAELKARLEELERKKGDLEAQLKALEEAAAVSTVKSLEERLSELESDLARLELLYSRLEKVKSAVREVLRAQRKTGVENLNAWMNRIIKSVYPTEPLESVRLEIVEKKSGRGPPVSYYEILVDVSGRSYRFSDLLSDGQKSLVVLALLLAIYSQMRKNTDFVMLDEPLPNVDEKVKVNFLRALAEAANVSQVIVTTQSESAARSIPNVNVVKL